MYNILLLRSFYGRNCMRTASLVLGIVGGCIALVIALFVIFGGVVFSTVVPSIDNSEFYTEYDDVEYDRESMETSSKIAGTVFIVMGSILFVSAILGIVGGIFVKKKNVLAGIFMLVGAAISIFTLWGFMASLLLLLGGIFALVKERNNASAVSV